MRGSTERHPVLLLGIVLFSLVAQGCVLERRGSDRGAVLWNESRLAALAAAWADSAPTAPSLVVELLGRAERRLTAGPYSVLDCCPPPGDDPRDFVSYGAYWWPDPDRPDGLPWVHRDGSPNPDAEGDMASMKDMTNAVRDLALAWRITGQERFAERAALLLRTWFVTPETRMTPRCRYGKIIPGRSDGGLVVAGMADRFRVLVDAVGCLEGATAWTASDREGWREWCRQFRLWLETSPEGLREREMANNHGTAYDLLDALLACAAGEEDEARAAVARWRDVRQQQQILPSGEQPREDRRADGLLYHLFNCRLALELGLLARRLGEPDPATEAAPAWSRLRTAVDVLLPYLTGRAVWPGDPEGRFPLKRRLAGEVLVRAALLFKSDHYLELATRIASCEPLRFDALTLTALPGCNS